MLNLIQSRRTVRSFTAQPVARADIETLLSAAAWAPSAHNRRPWRFAVLTNPADKDRLARAMGQAFRRDRLADGASPETVERDLNRSYRRITAPPVVIIVCLSMRDMDDYPDETRRRREWTMAVQSVSMAAQTMWLAAHSLGLAMGWLCAPLFAPQATSETLALPPDWEPLGLMTLGYAAEQPQKTRGSLTDRVLWIETQTLEDTVYD